VVRIPVRGKLKALWKESPLWGPDVVRKWERRFALSVEYAAKAVYGGIIWWGTGAVYLPENLVIHAWIVDAPDRIFEDDRIRKVKASLPGPTSSRSLATEPSTQVVTALVSKACGFATCWKRRDSPDSDRAPRLGLSPCHGRAPVQRRDPDGPGREADRRQGARELLARDPGRPAHPRRERRASLRLLKPRGACDVVADHAQAALARASVIALLLFLLIAVVALRKALYYAAEPDGEKDCPPWCPPGPIRPGPSEFGRWCPHHSSGCSGWHGQRRELLSATPVYGVVAVREVDDVRAALAFARDNGLKVSVAGVRHSMGGQAFARNAVVLDMTRLNQMSLDAQTRTLTVQSGATWHDIQSFLPPAVCGDGDAINRHLHVGGSIAVNAHGMDHQAGSSGGRSARCASCSPTARSRR